MKIIHFTFAFALAACAVAAQAKTRLDATITLRSGAVISAEFRTPAIAGSTAFQSDAAIDSGLVRRLSFYQGGNRATATLANGDVVSLAVSTPAFALRTATGPTELSVSDIRSLSLKPVTIPDEPFPQNGLVFHCSFDSMEKVAEPEVGPKIKINNARIVDNALYVARGLSSIEIPFNPGELGASGCIEFYAKFIDGKTEFSTGGDPRFFTMFKNETEEIGMMEYASNNGSGDSGIHTRFIFGDMVSNRGAKFLMPYSDIFKGKPYDGWHHYALVWDAKGITGIPLINGETPTVAILLDGKSTGCKIRTKFAADAIDSFLSSPIIIGIPMRKSGPSFNNKSSYLMDELKIWNYAKTKFEPAKER